MQPVGLIRMILALWVAIWLGLWFFGVRDAFWPPWPWKTPCQQLFERYSGDIFDDGENVSGPAPIMETLRDEGCITLDEEPGRTLSLKIPAAHMLHAADSGTPKRESGAPIKGP